MRIELTKLDDKPPLPKGYYVLGRSVVPRKGCNLHVMDITESTNLSKANVSWFLTEIVTKVMKFEWGYVFSTKNHSWRWVQE